MQPERSLLTPETFITASRRSPATPNRSGTLALFTLSTYSLERQSDHREVRVLDLTTGTDFLFTNDSKVKGLQWVGINDLVVWQSSGKGGGTEIWIGDIKKTYKEYIKWLIIKLITAYIDHSSYCAGSFDKPLSIIKGTKLSDKSFAILMLDTGPLSGSMSTLGNPVDANSTGREYTTLQVRDWDHYVTAESKGIWYLGLHEDSSGRGKYGFLSKKPINALKGTEIQFVVSSAPTPGSGDPVNYDLSKNGIILVGKGSSNTTRLGNSELYYIPLTTFTEEPAPKPKKFLTDGFGGCSSLPRFSPCATSLVYLKRNYDVDPAGKNVIFLVRGLSKDVCAVEICLSVESREWSLSPENVEWSSSGEELYVAATQCGRRRLFKIIVEASKYDSTPTPVPIDGSVSNVQPYISNASDHHLLITTSTFIDSSSYSTVDPLSGQIRQLSSLFRNGEIFGLCSSQVSEIWYRGAGDCRIHTWVIKPSNFDKSRMYPLALLIHGGPLGSWTDSWSARWNPVLFAEQGYVVVLPDITGSIGYTTHLRTAVIGDWGGQPLRDLEACFAHVKSNLPFVDTSRSVALGASFGGYMIYWLAGQPFAKEFKALVSHDGIFSTRNLYATDLPDSFNLLFAGHHMWEEGEGGVFDRWDPARHTDKWTTPMLVIHSEMDYRCPISMGLAAFATLQLRGVESRLLLFPDEGHFVLKPENSLHWHRTVLGWINRFAGITDS